MNQIIFNLINAAVENQREIIDIPEDQVIDLTPQASNEGLTEI